MLNEIDPKVDEEQVQAAMENQKSIAVSLAMENDSKYIIYTPIGVVHTDKKQYR